MKHLVFVYGSLREGYWNHGHLGDSPFLGYASPAMAFSLWLGDPKGGTVPTCCPSHTHQPKLIGEVYEVDADTKQALDWLETGYKSAQFPVTFEKDSKSVEATIYHHDAPSDCPYIKGKPEQVMSGDYTKAVSKAGKRI